MGKRGGEGQCEEFLHIKTEKYHITETDLTGKKMPAQAAGCFFTL